MQGSGGGPSEDNVSGYLVRSVAKRWGANSAVALDAGIHLAGIIDILATNPPRPPAQNNVPVSPSTSATPETLPMSVSIPAALEADSSATVPAPSCSQSPSPFTGCALPHTSTHANAAHILQNLVSSYLITHTHLDHLSGFVMNTAAFDHAHPKLLVAHPPAISAIKKHIFNDMIWPNLSDENNGVGLLSYRRLPPGDPYAQVADGLSAQIHLVSHGHCMNNHFHVGRASTAGLHGNEPTTPSHHASQTTRYCVIDSSVYFLRCDLTNHEIMMWGDVEPDSVSLDPRNFLAWELAAPKIVDGRLNTIFIECSYDDSQPDSMLFGHLTPRHLIVELATLAGEVDKVRRARREKKERERREKLKRQRNRNSMGYYSGGELAQKKHRRTEPPPPRRGSVGTSIDGGVRTPPPEDQVEDDSEYYEGEETTAEEPPRVDPKVDMFRGSFSFGDCRANSDGSGSLSSSGLSGVAAPLLEEALKRGAAAAAATETAAGESPQESNQIQKTLRPMSSSSTSLSAPASFSGELPIVNSNNDRIERTTTPPPVATSSTPTPTPPTTAAATTSTASSSSTMYSPPLSGVTIVITHVKETMRDGIDVKTTVLAELQRREKDLKLGCEFIMARRGMSLYV